ncbi:hypothetical protein [Candidatus Regiella insecticola]|uniref:hypothetical protein n=1 Tax=Candidatus Regiella insecticola TaxID=138073 RepID=UPI0003047B79|nr:hypothetical protein [Candidatus Regiella insecticola]
MHENKATLPPPPQPLITAALSQNTLPIVFPSRRCSIGLISNKINILNGNSVLLVY